MNIAKSRLTRANKTRKITTKHLHKLVICIQYTLRSLINLSSVVEYEVVSLTRTADH